MSLLRLSALLSPSDAHWGEMKGRETGRNRVGVERMYRAGVALVLVNKKGLVRLIFISNSSHQEFEIMCLATIHE